MSSWCRRPSRPGDPKIPRGCGAVGRGGVRREGGVAASGNVGGRLASDPESRMSGVGFVAASLWLVRIGSVTYSDEYSWERTSLRRT